MLHLMRYIPALDGLRALAVLAVVARHSWIEPAVGGYIGVDLFFVLSGFLITQVLMQNADLTRFYIRRARRLIPALAFMLVAYLAIFPLIRPDGQHWRDAALAFFYLSDFTYSWAKVPNYLGHTWSLSTEEHFYLLWPLVFLRLRPSVRALIGIYIALTAWRWLGPPWMEGGYFRMDMHSSGLILGCIIAQLPRVRFPAWPGLVVLAVLCVVMPPDTAFTQGPGILLAELAAAVAIFGTAPKWLETPPLVYLGKLSYGIYLWHFSLSRLMHEGGYRHATTLAATLAFSVVMAAVSYHLIESRFRVAHRPAEKLAGADAA